MQRPFQFALLADSHIRLPESVSEGGYPSNRLSVARAEHAVRCVNRLQPAFVVHLGDTVHPIPALKGHETAIRQARRIFSALNAPLYVLPGNHDIGDKPGGWLPAPVVDAASDRFFTRHWGPLYQSFDHQGCHFVCLDTPDLNSGLRREHEQRAWLEANLRASRAAGKRIFVFMHYPPFLCTPDEPEHYDNLAEPARGWLLDLFTDLRVEAVFSAHVHNTFLGVVGETRYYTLPSLAFVRPEYSELASAAPADAEFGRDDVAKLGFFLVEVSPEGHRVIPVRTYGADERPAGMTVETCRLAAVPPKINLGATLRRGWATRLDLAADGLDEFTRKEAYRDALPFALLELGITALRVPLADFARTESRKRLAEWRHFGFEFTLFSAGAPDEDTQRLLRQAGHLLAAWEIILPHRRPPLDAVVRAARAAFPGPLFLAPSVPIRPPKDEHTFEHFASHGFAPGQAAEARAWLTQAGDEGVGVTVRVSPWDDPAATLRAIARLPERKMVNLQLPRRDEGIPFDDDAAIARFVRTAWQVSREMPDTPIFLDTLVDSDRGYYPRHALLDRRFNPRPAFYALKQAIMESA